MSFGNINFRINDDYPIANFSQIRQNVFKSKTKKITENIGNISKNTSECQKMTQDFGTKHDSHHQYNDNNRTVIELETTNLVRDTLILIEELSSLPPADDESERKRRNIKIEQLKDQMTQALNAIQALQIDMKNKNTYQQAPDSLDHLVIGHFENSGLGQQQIQRSSETEQDLDVMVLEERSSLMKHIEGEVTDINVIFQDLGELVHEQGNTMSAIEDNLDEAVIFVDNGKKELETIVSKKIANWKKKLICIIVIAVPVLIIIVVLLASFI